MLLPLTHTRLVDQIIHSKAESYQGCVFRKTVKLELPPHYSGLYFSHISHCRLTAPLQVPFFCKAKKDYFVFPVSLKLNPVVAFGN